MDIKQKNLLNEDVEKLLDSVDSNECSIYEHENCYYEKQSRLSNFIFVPVERVHANKDEYLKGHIALSNGETLKQRSEKHRNYCSYLSVTFGIYPLIYTALSQFDCCYYKAVKHYFY